MPKSHAVLAPKRLTEIFTDVTLGGNSLISTLYSLGRQMVNLDCSILDHAVNVGGVNTKLELTLAALLGGFTLYVNHAGRDFLHLVEVKVLSFLKNDNVGIMGGELAIILNHGFLSHFLFLLLFSL
jgi:hypothetical protein